LHRNIQALSNDLPPVLWWIHDGIHVIDSIKDRLPKKLGKNINIYCGSEYSQRLIINFGKDYHSEILRYGVEDVSRKFKDSFNQMIKLNFLQ
jgi:hypothetical protein